MLFAGWRRLVILSLNCRNDIVQLASVPMLMSAGLLVTSKPAHICRGHGTGTGQVELTNPFVSRTGIEIGIHTSRCTEMGEGSVQGTGGGARGRKRDAHGCAYHSDGVCHHIEAMEKALDVLHSRIHLQQPSPFGGQAQQKKPETGMPLTASRNQESSQDVLSRLELCIACSKDTPMPDW